MNIHSLLFYRTILKFSTLFLESSTSLVLVKNAFQARLVNYIAVGTINLQFERRDKHMKKFGLIVVGIIAGIVALGQFGTTFRSCIICIACVRRDAFLFKRRI